VNEIRYTSTGDSTLVAIARGSRVLVVDRSAGPERVGDLWSNVRDGADLRAILDVLTRGGISSTPSFALVESQGEFGSRPVQISVLVRGAIEVVVATASEKITMTGREVSTWVERVVTEAVSLEIGLASPGGGVAAEQEQFILLDGSAPVNWLAIGSALPVSVKPAIPPVTAAPTPEPPVDATIDPGRTITDAPPSERADDNDAGGGYDFLFGETVVRTVEDAAVRSEEPAAPGDHDGRTAIGLTAAERRAARRERQKTSEVHAAPAPQFQLEFSTGATEELDGAIIVGRAPSASKVGLDSVPRLVTVGGPDQDISRNHVRVSLEGGTVMVTDLHSRNGTVVTLPGRAPQQLRGGQPTAVIAGAIIDLGSDVTITVREH
jgi:hypothetical protein